MKFGKEKKKKWADASDKQFIKRTLERLRYKDKRKTCRHVMWVLDHFECLAVISDKIEYEHKGGERCSEMLCVQGMVTVSVRREEYQIPIRIAVHPDYPKRPPIVFINESEELQLKDRHKDPDYDYLSLHILINWLPGHSDLKLVVPYMVEEFLAQKAVYKVLFDNIPAESKQCTSDSEPVPSTSSSCSVTSLEEETEEKTIIPSTFIASPKTTEYEGQEHEVGSETPVKKSNDKSKIKTEIRKDVNTTTESVNDINDDVVLDLRKKKEVIKIEVVSDEADGVDKRGAVVMASVGCQTDQPCTPEVRRSFAEKVPIDNNMDSFKRPKDVEIQTVPEIGQFDWRDNFVNEAKYTDKIESENDKNTYANDVKLENEKKSLKIDIKYANEPPEYANVVKPVNDPPKYANVAKYANGKKEEEDYERFRQAMQKKRDSIGSEKMRHVEYLDMRNDEITEDKIKDDGDDEKFATIQHSPTIKLVCPLIHHENTRSERTSTGDCSRELSRESANWDKYGSLRGSPMKSNVLLDMNENISTMENANLQRPVHHGARMGMVN